MPIDSGIDAGQIADALLVTGRTHGERPLSLVNATSVHLGDVQRLIESITALTTRGDWVIVPVDPVSENPSAVPVVRAASAALLVVRLGESLLPSARAAVEAIGRDRFLGSVVIGEGFPKKLQPLEG